MKTRLIVGVLFCLCWAGLSLAHDKEDRPQEAEAPEEMLEIEELIDIEEDEDSRSPLQSFLGGQHPALVHFPIGWMTLLCLVELVGLSKRRLAWHKAGVYLLAVTVISFVPAIITGLLQSDLTIFTGEYMEIVYLHRNLNFIAATATTIALILRWKLKTDSNRMHRFAYLVIIVLTALLTLYSGHLGGRLVHG